MATQIERSSATVGAILVAARKLFAERGFDSTSVDEIATAAGVAKGAVYHHFDSKEGVFTRVLEDVQAQIAATPPPVPANGMTDPLDLAAAGVLHYLNTATEPGVKQILLIDGPVVIGWRKWREIDDRYFAGGAKVLLAHVLGEDIASSRVEALVHLVMGAVMEAALVCAAAEDPRGMALILSRALRTLLEGLRTDA